MPSWTPFNVGDEIIGLVIISVINVGNYQNNTNYKIRYLCCGREEETTHEKLAQRVRRNAKLCVTCARKQNGKNFGSTKPLPKEEPEPMPGVRDLRGEFWPFITTGPGQMGPR